MIWIVIVLWSVMLIAEGMFVLQDKWRKKPPDKPKWWEHTGGDWHDTGG